MTQAIYVFSGPCGSGKSTLSQAFARQLAEKDRQGQVYLIHGDDFHMGFIESGTKKKPPLLSWPEILRFNWDCICSTADKALAVGLDVVIDYVVEEELSLMEELAQRYGARLYYVVLTASEEELRQRLMQRGEPDLTDRSLFLKEKLEHLPENQGHLFDTTAMTVEEEMNRLDISRYLR